jgi:hypothetical protein
MRNPSYLAFWVVTFLKKGLPRRRYSSGDYPGYPGHRPCGKCEWCLRYNGESCMECTCSTCWRIGTDL